MNKRSIRYRDTWAAPGSQLHAALTDGNKKLAESIYTQCEKDRAKLEGRDKPALQVRFGQIDHDVKGGAIHDPTAVRIMNAVAPIPGVNVLNHVDRHGKPYMGCQAERYEKPSCAF
jgi:hypothetical protein